MKSKHHYLYAGVALAACLAAAPPIRANVVLSVQPVIVNSGTTGNAFDLLLTNTNLSAINIAGFFFGISTSDTDITFTDANTATTAASYIFAGDSFDDINGFTLYTNLSPQTVEGSDGSNTLTGATIASGATLGIGHIVFSVSSGATLSAVIDWEQPFTSLSDADGNAVDFTTTPGTITVTPSAAVPEPGHASLALCALLGLAFWTQRRRTQFSATP